MRYPQHGSSHSMQTETPGSFYACRLKTTRNVGIKMCHTEEKAVNQSKDGEVTLNKIN